MIYLLDTNAISDLMREHVGMTQRLSSLGGGDRVVTCSIVLGELRYGIGRLALGKRRDELAAKATAVLAVLPCVSVGPESADHYAETKLAQQALGLSLDENDLWIAAVVKTVGAILVTRDRDFLRVAGLSAEDWAL